MPHRKTIAIAATALAAMVARASSLLSQAVVGIYLTEEQVGTYALALGIVGVTGIWRSGGVSMYLPSAKQQDFDRLANPMFLWAFGFGFATLLLTAAIAAVDDRLPESLAKYRLPGLPMVLVVMAGRAALFPLPLIGRMRLAVEHRFVPLAKVDTANALIRLGLTWWIAANGGGAMALAVPFTAHVLVEAAAVAMLGGFRWSDLAPRLGSIRPLVPLLAWPLALAIIMSLRTDISFLLVGIVLPAAALGVFYFAFQLANQPTLLLASSLQNVLAPMIAKNRGNPELERISLERVFASSMLFVPITTLAAASVFPPAERLVWAGKWASAGPSVTLLCVGATYATVVALILGPLIGLQRFKESTWFELLKMGGAVGGAVLGGVVIAVLPPERRGGIGDVTCVAAFVAAGMVATSLAQLVWIARRYRFDRAETVRNLLFGPLLAGLTALAAYSIGHSLVSTLNLPDDRRGALVELVVVAATYTVLIAMAVRFTAESTLRDTVQMFPARARHLVARLLLLG